MTFIEVVKYSIIKVHFHRGTNLIENIADRASLEL